MFCFDVRRLSEPYAVWTGLYGGVRRRELTHMTYGDVDIRPSACLRRRTASFISCANGPWDRRKCRRTLSFFRIWRAELISQCVVASWRIITYKVCVSPVVLGVIWTDAPSLHRAAAAAGWWCRPIRELVIHEKSHLKTKSSHPVFALRCTCR